MENVQRTIYAAYIQTCKELGLPIQYPPYTTINQALDILSNYDYPTNANPILQYAIFGNGGATFQQGANGIETPVPLQHQATDANLYNTIPLVLRLPTNDLTPSEMTNYRLRKLITVNGTVYVAYYGLLLNNNNTNINMYTINNSNGNSVSQLFTPTALNLNPSPQNLTSLNVNTVTGDYVNVNALSTINLSASQVADFLNAATILYGSPYAAIISEVGVCTGFDVENTLTINNTSSTYTEAVGVQVNAFVNTFYAMYYSQNGLNVTYNVGATEPLMILQTTNS